MAVSNAIWGAERIRGELLKLGIHVAKRTIQRYLRAVRPPAPPRGQKWHTFLRNHTVWASDDIQTYDIWFTAPAALPRFARAVVPPGLRPARSAPGLRPLGLRPIFAFFIIDINAKEVIHVGVTRGPSEKWTAQQLRDATPFGQGPHFIIRDRDDKFGADFDRAAKGAGTKIIRTAVKAPLMNSICERFVGSARRECLDHIILIGERHMKHVLDEFCLRYFNTRRPHQGLAQRIPVSTPRQTCSDASKVVAMPVLGGLHHDYQVAAWPDRIMSVASTGVRSLSQALRSSSPAASNLSQRPPASVPLLLTSSETVVHSSCAPHRYEWINLSVDGTPPLP